VKKLLLSIREINPVNWLRLAVYGGLIAAVYWATLRQMILHDWAEGGLFPLLPDPAGGPEPGDGVLVQCGALEEGAAGSVKGRKELRMISAGIFLLTPISF